MPRPHRLAVLLEVPGEAWIVLQIDDTPALSERVDHESLTIVDPTQGDVVTHDQRDKAVGFNIRVGAHDVDLVIPRRDADANSGVAGLDRGVAIFQLSE